MNHPLLCVLLFSALLNPALGDLYDPPSGYYNSATGAGATLKNQLHNLIDDHNDIGYNALRTALQVTDADPADPDRILLVYDRTSLDVSNLGGSIPGWDSGVSWNREHVWPRARGVDSSGPDNSDLFNHRPSDPQINNDRGSLNFGGVYGQQSYGLVSDGGDKWYPGDADAGMVARAMFYMATRYDGSDSATTDLELATGNPGGDGLGDLNRMIEWHFAAPPDDFERRRNQLVYEYQNNRNPFIDHPEYAWSVFVDQANDSRIALQGAAAQADGGTTLNVDLGRVYVGGAAPATSLVTLGKSGFDGTYYSVTTTGAATSSLGGALNAFRTNQNDSTALTVGLEASSSTPGVVSGQVRIDNLDITTGGGTGRGAKDADDLINLSYTVLEHPVASFDAESILASTTIDLGTTTVGEPTSVGFSLFNYAGAGGPTLASLLELDSVTTLGDASEFDLSLDAFTWLDQGEGYSSWATLDADSVGAFSATFQLNLSGEDLPGDQTQSLLLTLTGTVEAAVLMGDFNGDLLVDAADYSVWRAALGTSATLGGAGVNDGVVDQQDYLVWRANFGQTGQAPAASATPIPSPAGLPIGGILAAMLVRSRRRCRSFVG